MFCFSFRNMLLWSFWQIKKIHLLFIYKHIMIACHCGNNVSFLAHKLPAKNQSVEITVIVYLALLCTNQFIRYQFIRYQKSTNQFIRLIILVCLITKYCISWQCRPAVNYGNHYFMGHCQFRKYAYKLMLIGTKLKVYEFCVCQFF